MDPSPSGPELEIKSEREKRQPTPFEGLCLLLASWGLFVLASLLHRGPVPASGLFQSAVLVAAALLPALAWIAARGRWAMLSPRAADLRRIPGVAFVLAAASVSSLGVAGLLSNLAAAGGEEEALSTLLQPYPMLLRLLLFALTPAICEELLFRGAVMACFSSWPKRANCLFSALAFAAFHSSLIRFAPSALLGYGFSLVSIRGGSLLYAVAAHAIHNAAVLVIAGSGFKVGALPVGVFIAAAAGGIAVLVMESRKLNG